MPYRSIDTLQSWVDEYVRRDSGREGQIRVIPQDGEGGADTGLVAFRLRNSPTEVYIEPPDGDSGEWTVTFEPRTETVRITCSTMQVLADETASVATLCRFLQDKSDAFLRARDAGEDTRR